MDLSFSDEESNSSQVIKEMLAWEPYDKNLILFLKYFLRQNNLHEVYTGGMGSYTIYLLCIYYVKARTPFFFFFGLLIPKK